jgi:hypothetical protein
VLALGALWALGVGGGFAALGRYGSAPGPSAPAPGEWPAATRARRAPGRLALVVLLHPKCPCSRATLTELREIVGKTRAPFELTVFFVRPAGVPEGWEKTDLWRDAATLPGALVLADEGGLEAARFGAATSGEVLLYDGKGLRLFAGGITSARGHAGTSVGEQAVAALLAGERS